MIPELAIIAFLIGSYLFLDLYDAYSQKRLESRIVDVLIDG